MLGRKREKKNCKALQKRRRKEVAAYIYPWIRFRCEMMKNEIIRITRRKYHTRWFLTMLTRSMGHLLKPPPSLTPSPRAQTWTCKMKSFRNHPEKSSSKRICSIVHEKSRRERPEKRSFSLFFVREIKLLWHNPKRTRKALNNFMPQQTSTRRWVGVGTWLNWNLFKQNTRKETKLNLFFLLWKRKLRNGQDRKFNLKLLKSLFLSIFRRVHRGFVFIVYWILWIILWF
jgi:hypothetical protein